ncbi:selenocysteine insertion sequence-binding protein 2-like isoform X2 [Erpetoichthys calabaricus]|uniref:selenocysteine insertion sequence-binding protein 2-like isoform X2 n=1 Tax=Erpetoichthys calabaricus TaxID=27687 RepID=UPI002234729A|nr:selenocysteine insertion sequence-binding protein 2-like isoform X2 [Erpetoichthys calabaricus]
METNDNKDVKLSAEVEPFIPQKKGTETVLVPVNLSNDNGGGSNMNNVEPAPIPSYLITCYPFVQENQPNRQLPLYNSDLRWQQPNPSSTGPYLAYPILPSPQPPVSNDYTYYQIMPAPCAPMMGFYHPFPTPYGASIQTTGVVNAMSTECGDRPMQTGQILPVSGQRVRGIIRSPVIAKLPQQIRSKRPLMRSVAIQKEISASGPDSRSKTVLLVDASQQTDFPGEIASRSLSERASPLVWKTKTRRRRASHPTAESSSEHGASEADIDSDSGYCSPKHSHHQQTGTLGTRPLDSSSAVAVEPLVMSGTTWVNVASQVTQRSWFDRTSPYFKGGKLCDQRNYAMNGYRGRGQSVSCERKLSLQKRPDGKPQTIGHLPGTKPDTESLYFEDEKEFPDLNTVAAVSRNKTEQMQSKIPKNLLENLPENSPINIVQTPIPITTSVPKRAKSQRKKALAAALATAQEYSEISMEQKKLQDALTKAAGKKSKTPVQLDLGDMLAALEKQQQAMKARQLTNTKPLSYTVGTSTPFHTKDSSSKRSLFKSQPYSLPHNILDSAPPRVKRGKEREIPKVKRPTALKKIILKEREVKKGKYSVDHNLTEPEEQGDLHLHFTDDQSHEGVSQEELGLSVPSDASLSPASQNSPYSITPVSQGSPASSGIGSPMATSAITKIHSRRFREYCNQVLSKEIDESVTVLLQELVRFQERVYQKDPVKAKAKRRLVMGLREVTKHMKLHKIKCVIISPNCEKIQSKGGLDEALYNVIAMAREQEIPFVFALGRKALGRCVNKLVPVSVVGIFNFSGAETLFNKLVSLTEEARKAYKDMVSALEQEQAEEALKNIKKVPHHMGHSRNPSAASAISFCSVISEPISEVNEKEYETNWRNMVETSDGLETSEIKDPSSRTAVPDKPSVTAPDKDNETCAALPSSASNSVSLQPTKTMNSGSEKDDGKPDDILEWASLPSTETGSLDGSCRDLLNSSITSTTSTLVPGMLEEGEDEDDEEEDDYAHEPISVEVPLSSRIESWVTEAQKTLENLQLGKNEDSTEEDDGGHSEEEELELPEQTDTIDHKDLLLETKS